MSDLLKRTIPQMSNYGNIADMVFALPVHPLYDKYKRQWGRVRDVLEGTDAVKMRGTRYLPQLSAQSSTNYNAYKDRAMFLNSSARIVSTNVGTIVRRSPTLSYPDSMVDYFSKDTVSFVSFRELMKMTIHELLITGRVGCLVEIDTINDMPIPVSVNTENIINWTLDSYGNVTDILIYNAKEVSGSNKFDVNHDNWYYHLYLGADNVYMVDEYKDNDLINTRVPSLKGKTLDFIPFVCANSLGLNMSPLKPPILDVVDVNLSHYRTSADLETGRHFVGLPQPIVSGATADKLVVGSSKAWVLPSDKAKAYYLEFVGQGLDGLAKALKEKESQMAQFSAQLQDVGTKGSEAESTVRLRYASDAANLSDIAQSAESMLNSTYNTIAVWMEEDDVPSIELNKDFISDKMSYNELTALTKSWFDGGISDEEYRYNLKRGEIIPIEELDKRNSANSSKNKTTMEE